MIDTPATGTWTSSNPSSIAFHSNGSAGQLMIVLAPGVDTLIYTVYNLCGTRSDTLIYEIGAAGVKNINSIVSKISVMPNPNQGNFNMVFTSELDEVAHVSITNIMGQEVTSYVVRSNTVSNMEINAPDGVYFISATTKAGKYDTRIIVAH